MVEYKDRLQKAMTRANVTVTALAKELGISYQGVKKVVDGGSAAFTAANNAAAAAFLEVSPDWLATGKGRMDLASAPQSTLKTDTKADGFVIPQYAAGGGMGNGLILEEKQPGVIKSWHVDHEWLRLNVRHHTGVNNLCIVTGFGPSMQPKYNPGDPLLLDRGVTTVETEGIFFFRVGKHGYIKQLQRIPTEDGMIVRAKSLNPTYDPFDITGKMDFEVFGKVLTVWRSEQV